MDERMVRTENSWFISLLEWIGMERSDDLVVYYLLYDWAMKVTNIGFAMSYPLLLTSLGDLAFGQNKGRILFSCIVTIVSILTAISYLTFTSVFEYGYMKRKTLYWFSLSTCICFLLFIFCFFQDAIYLACMLVICGKVSQSIASLAYDSLLDSVSVNQDTHIISSHGYIVGYIGMFVFGIISIPIIAIFYFVLHVSILWFAGIIPLFLAGSWYMYFLHQVNRHLPSDLGKGIQFEYVSYPKNRNTNINHKTIEQDENNDTHISVVFNSIQIEEDGINLSTHSISDDSNHHILSNNIQNKNTSAYFVHIIEYMANTLYLFYYGFKQGSHLQYQNILEIRNYPDLSYLIVSLIFLNGGSGTGQSVAIIIITQILHIELIYIVIAAITALISAMLGIMTYNTLIRLGYITPQYVLVVNKSIMILVFISVLFAKNSISVICIAAIAGFQIGPIGALTRSIISSLIPAKHQIRLFSLIQFSQDATAWIGSLTIAFLASIYGSGDKIYIHVVISVCIIEIVMGLPFLVMMNYERGCKLRIDKDEIDENA